jgi:glycosyltransferase involved in cell wall biosynthesis
MDLLYVRIAGVPPRECRWAISPFRQLFGFPLVVWEFNTVPEFGLIRGRTEEDVQRTVQILQHLGKGCDLAICMTQELADYVKNFLKIKRVLIVPNGSDPDLFHPDVDPVKRVSKSDELLDVIWIGSAKLAWNNFNLLREAAHILIEDHAGKNVVFHIVGPGLTGVMGDMPHNVHYYGGEKYEKLPHWLACMDVGLMIYDSGPADYASPLKLFDYMASGLTVVSTDHPFIRRLFEKMGQSDLLITSNNPQELANILINLEQNPERVHQLGVTGRNLIIDHYNWHRAVQDTFQEIKALLK